MSDNAPPITIPLPVRAWGSRHSYQHARAMQEIYLLFMCCLYHLYCPHYLPPHSSPPGHIFSQFLSPDISGTGW